MITPDDLTFPAFLDRRGEVARRWRAPKWGRLPPAQRPDGERWANAERWEAYVDPRIVPALAAGTRRLWVTEGRKWAYLRDAEASARVPLGDWRRMQRTAKQIS